MKETPPIERIHFLIAVVIICVLGVVLSSRLISLHRVVREAALRSAATNLTNASWMNFVRWQSGLPGFVSVHDCQDIAQLMELHSLRGHHIISSPLEKKTSCSVDYEAGNRPETFFAYYVP